MLHNDQKFLVKKFEKYFQIDNLIDRRGYRSHFLHQIVATSLNLQNKKQGFSQFYPLALYCEKSLKTHELDSIQLDSTHH